MTLFELLTVVAILYFIAYLVSVYTHWPTIVIFVIIIVVLFVLLNILYVGSLVREWFIRKWRQKHK